MEKGLLWNIVYWTWIFSEVLILVVTRTRRGGGEIHDRGSLLILWPVIVLSITAGAWFGEVHAHTLFRGAHWVRVAALALLAVGLALRWAAILSLGKSFSANVAIHATQKVNKSGLFRYVRHPSYSAMLLIFIAVGMHTRNWIGSAIVVLPCLAALLYRIHVEEAALRGGFGQEYIDYSAKTKRLIPGVY